MTSKFFFPQRFLDCGFLNEICSSYQIEPSESLLDRAVISDFFLKDNLDDCVAALVDSHVSISVSNGVIELQNESHYDDDQAEDFINHCRHMDIPYDSIEGEQRYIYLFRPELAEQTLSLPYHSSFGSIAFSAKKLMQILDMDIPPEQLAQVLLFNLKEDISPVPKLHSYQHSLNKDFKPTGLRDIRLLY